MNALSEIEWKCIITSENANTAFNQLYDKFLSTFRNNVPIVDANHMHVGIKPWVKADLKCKIKENNKQHHKYKCNPNTINLQNYKKFNNQLNNTLQRAKQRFYMRKLASSTNSKQ